MNIFNNIDITAEEFLRDYWQQKPLLIKQGLEGFTLPVESDELAGLCFEEDVESRLVIEKAGSKSWELKTGPFNETAFEQLPASHWTLLLQAVDFYLPEIAELKHYFRFIPDWRVDDIMASVSPEHGSVGPHFDYYDVFLIQAEGKRLWKLGQNCNDQSELLADTDLKILTDFDQQQEFLLEPGDILYVPPRLAHYGIAMEQGVTLSVGFRALSEGEILDSFAASIADELPESLRFIDPEPSIQKHPALISQATVNHLRSIIEKQLTDDNLANWFGKTMTEFKYADQNLHLEEPYNLTEYQNMLSEDLILVKNQESRLAAFESNNRLHVFANGESVSSIEIDNIKLMTVIHQLLDNWNLDTKSIQQLDLNDQEFFRDLLNSGVLEIE